MKVADLKKTSCYKKMKENGFAVLTVPKAWCVRFDLTPTELFILEEIIWATEKLQRAVYSGSRQKLATIINGSLPTVDKALNKLEERGFIRKEISTFTTQGGTDRDVVTYRSLLPLNCLPNDARLEEILACNRVRREAINKV